MNAEDKLQRIFRDVFDDDELIITSDMTANDVDGWDSLSHVNLIVAIETRFNIRFSQRELLGFKTVDDLLRCIESKIQK